MGQRQTQELWAATHLVHHQGSTVCRPPFNHSLECLSLAVLSG